MYQPGKRKGIKYEKTASFYIQSAFRKINKAVEDGKGCRLTDLQVDT